MGNVICDHDAELGLWQVVAELDGKTVYDGDPRKEHPPRFADGTRVRLGLLAWLDLCFFLDTKYPSKVTH